MVIIEYCLKGKAISDFEAELWLIAFMDKIKSYPDNYIIRISTSEPFHLIRREIAEGRLDCEQVKFKYKEKIIDINKYGAILDWPDGFANVGIETSTRILKAACKRRQDERKIEKI